MILNPLLQEAILDRPRLALNILSALRGPDDEDYEKKVAWTAPIRLWALGKEGYSAGNFVPYLSDVSPLTSGQVWKAVYEGGLPRVGHYMNHIFLALRAIAMLEGWNDEVGE